MNLDDLSTVEQYKVKAMNRSHMVAYSIFYLKLIKGDYKAREKWILEKSFDLWLNTIQ